MLDCEDFIIKCNWNALKKMLKIVESEAVNQHIQQALAHGSIFYFNKLDMQRRN